MESARAPLESLGVDFVRDVIIFRYAKPDPDVFLVAAPRSGRNMESASVAGDNTCDMPPITPCPCTPDRRAVGGLQPRAAGARGSVPGLSQSQGSGAAHRRSGALSSNRADAFRSGLAQ